MDGSPRAAFYETLDEDAAGRPESRGRYASSDCTVGPWHPDHQHGGPPAALLVRAVERLGGAPSPSLVARASVDILSPVPVVELEVRAWVARGGRRVALCQAEALADGIPLVRVSAWRIRLGDSSDEIPTVGGDAAPTAGVARTAPVSWGGGYLGSVLWEEVEGSFDAPGPATVWTRLLVSVVAGEIPSGVQRTMAVADSGSGISAVADPRRLLFVNTEMTVHLVRESVGERVWMRSRTVIDRHGVGLATTALGDEAGSTGTAAQALFVAPR